jgi:acetoacetate decarboxylase
VTDETREPWRGARRPDSVDRAEIPERAWSMPWDAPTIPPFPVGFRNVSILTVTWRSDPQAIERLLPPPLEPVSDIVTAHFYRMDDVDFLGQLCECNVMVGARFPHPDGDVVGGYSAYQFLDSEGGVVHGREVHGQPKKLADVGLDLHGDLLVGRVARNSIEVLTATLPYKQQPCDSAEMLEHYDFRENLNFKVLPQIDGTPAVRQITSRRLEDVKVDGCWRGPATVELRPNALAPVFRLPVLEHLDGYLWLCDFTLVAGRVLHDYLDER